MKLTMRWKLLGSHLLVALVMGGVLYGWLSSTLDKHMQEETRAGLLGEARLARLTSIREIGNVRRDAPGMAAAIARETRARVTFISLRGEVLGDSDVNPAELKELENHLNRPEVQQALKSGQGSSIRYSATLKIDMLYVAFPFQSAAGEGACCASPFRFHPAKVQSELPRHSRHFPRRGALHFPYLELHPFQFHL